MTKNDFDNIKLSSGETMGDFLAGKKHNPEHYGLSYSCDGVHLTQGNKDLFVVDRKHEALMTKIWYLLNMDNHKAAS